MLAVSTRHFTFSFYVAHRSYREGFLNIRFLSEDPPFPGLAPATFIFEALPGVAYGGAPFPLAASQSNGGGAESDGDDGVDSAGGYTNRLWRALRDAVA